MKWNNYHRLGVLILLSIGLILSLWGRQKSSITTSIRFFRAIDTAHIQKISFVRPHSIQYLSRPNGLWQLNERYGVNPTLKASFFYVLTHMVQGAECKPSIHMHIDSLTLDIQALGETHHYQLYFTSAGDLIGQRKFQNKAFYLRMPGQTKEWQALFRLSENQWRDRQIFPFSVLQITDIRLQYPDKPQDNWHIQIGAHQCWLNEQAVSPKTKNRIAQYLAQYEQFRINEFIDPTQIPIYDSLAHTKPFAILSLATHKDSMRMRIYQNKAKPYVLLQINQSTFALCETKRFKGFLVKENEWKIKKDSFILRSK